MALSHRHSGSCRKTAPGSAEAQGQQPALRRPRCPRWQGCWLGEALAALAFTCCCAAAPAYWDAGRLAMVGGRYAGTLVVQLLTREAAPVPCLTAMGTRSRGLL